MMKAIVLVLLGAFTVSGLTQAQTAKAPSTTKEKVGYGIGLDMGKNLKRQDVDADIEMLIRGIRDGVSGKAQAVSDQELQQVMEAFGRQMMEKQSTKAKAEGEKNKKEGEACLAANRKNPGVIELPSGIQYKVLKAGTGEKPTKDRTVVCHYRGTLTDGREFDSSIKRNEPATFPIANVIQGWQEILPLMPVGSKWQVVIPSHLAYGERSAGELIGPNATLIFEIELLSIQ